MRETNVCIVRCDSCRGAGSIQPQEYYERTSLYDSEWVTPKSVICVRCKGSGRLIQTIITEPYNGGKAFYREKDTFIDEHEETQRE